MGTTIWVETSERSRDDCPRDSSLMFRLQEELDALAAKLGVARLSDFHDYSALEGELEDLGDEGVVASDGREPAVEAEQLAERWYDPAMALAAVRVVHDHLVQHPYDLGFPSGSSHAHWPGALVDELSHCRSVLEGAVARGQQFRFLIVP